MGGEEEIVKKLKKQDRKAQRWVFDHYAPVLLGMCIRYARNRDEAEDYVQEAFVKIFMNIDQYEGKGSFEGWMKRVAVNTAITHFHRNKKHAFHDDVSAMHNRLPDNDVAETDFSHEDLLNVIQELPEGYKMVFNLYAIEGYKHKEISELLGIDENTSKSQFARARKYIQKKLSELIVVNS